MTAVSLSYNRGAGDQSLRMTNPTVGSLAPSSGDVELRFNVLDQNGHNLNDLDLVLIMKYTINWILAGGASVGGNLTVAVTNQPSGPPN